MPRGVEAFIVRKEFLDDGVKLQSAQAKVLDRPLHFFDGFDSLVGVHARESDEHVGMLIDQTGNVFVWKSGKSGGRLRVPSQEDHLVDPRFSVFCHLFVDASLELVPLEVSPVLGAVFPEAVIQELFRGGWT